MNPKSLDLVWRSFEEKADAQRKKRPAPVPAVVFSGAHDIHTPRVLCKEILDNLELSNKSILVLFNIEFVLSLVGDFGIESRNITFYSDHHTKTHYAKTLGADIVTELESSMKFDVIVGNPPYQDSNNDKRMLWNQILDKVVEVTNDNGYIAMVTPTTWLTAKTNIHNSYKMFEEKQVERAVIFDKNDKPFDEGTSVSYTITKNTKRAALTPLYFAQYSTGAENHVADIDISKDKIWPGQLTPVNIVIHNKLQTHKKIKFLKSCEFHNQKLKTKKMVSDTKDSVFQYTHHVSAAITRYTNTKFSAHDTWKVMVPLTSTIDKAVVDNNCGHGEDMLSLYVKDEKTALNIKSLFNTRFYKFIGMLYKSGRNQPLQNLFPVMDFSKVWTDAELYAHFGLTQEEIDYIEANVK